MATNYLTPPDPVLFFPKNNVFPEQIENAVDQYARQAANVNLEPFTIDAWIAIQRRLAFAEAKIQGLKNLWPDFYRKYWNLAGNRLEEEIGFDRLSTPRENGLINGLFTDWTSTTTPAGWTITGSPTIAQATARTGAFPNEFACQITAGVAAGSIARSDLRFQPGDIHSLSGWVAIASGTTVTIQITTNSATDVAQKLSLVGGSGGVGAGAGQFFHFPRQGGYQLIFTPNTDATTMTLTLTVSANGIAQFSSFSLGPGPMRDADLAYPAVEDIVNTSAPSVSQRIFGQHTSVPSGAAGGDLLGFYPNPQVINDNACLMVAARVFGG